jgi:HYR domain
MKLPRSRMLRLSTRLSGLLCLRLLMLAGLCLTLGVSVRPAHAQATLTVSDCSSDAQLQADVVQANSDNSGDTITFNCSADIVLTRTLTISGSMTLDGSGQSVTLDGGKSVQVFSVQGGVSFTLNALTIANGVGAVSPPPFPSFIGGGAILNNGGTLTISNSTLSSNSASGGEGGGLDNNAPTGSGIIDISTSTFSNNLGNSAIYNNNTGVELRISNSSFSNNTTGIFNGGMVSISNSTLSNNPNGIFSNTVGNFRTNIFGSIVAKNQVDCNKQPGTIPIVDNGYNLSSENSCGFPGTGSRQNTDPLLSGLANNGGPTQTMALQQGSPAIDQIPATNCPQTDQRGVSRPDDGESACDMGAYEFTGTDLRDQDLGLTGLPAPITVNATSPQGASVTFKPPTATDENGDSPGPTVVTCTPASGLTFPIGTTTVTCTASDSDDSNSPVSQSFTVTVKPVLWASGTSVSATEGKSFSGVVVATGADYGAGTLSAKRPQAVLDTASRHLPSCSPWVGTRRTPRQSSKGPTTSRSKQLIATVRQVQAVLCGRLLIPDEGSRPRHIPCPALRGRAKAARGHSHQVALISWATGEAKRAIVSE